LEAIQYPIECDLLLIEAAIELQLTPVEILAVALTIAVEEHALAGRAVARVQAPLGGSRPTLGLVQAAMSTLVLSDDFASDNLVSGSAAQTGLLELSNDGLPLPERTLSVPLHVLLALNNRDGRFPNASIGTIHADDVLLPPSLQRDIRVRANTLTSSPENLLVLRSGSMVEAKRVALTVAQELSQRPVFLGGEDTRALVPWLLLRGLLPVFLFDLAPGQRRVLPRLPGYQGPMMALGGPDGSVELEDGLASHWTIPVPNLSEPRHLWRAAVQNDQLADRMAREHRHGIGRIAQLGRQAHVHAQLNARDKPIVDDVLSA